MEINQVEVMWTHKQHTANSATTMVHALLCFGTTSTTLITESSGHIFLATNLDLSLLQIQKLIGAALSVVGSTVAWDPGSKFLTSRMGQDAAVVAAET